MQTTLRDIQDWYAAQCDGDWEHSFGVVIASLDNPGWSVKIDLTGTLLEDKSFPSVEKSTSKGYWINCQVEQKQFVGYGAPNCLEDILEIFLKWAKSESDWLALPSIAVQGERQQREFQAALGDEVGPKQCATPECEKLRILHSALCREHHTKMINGSKAGNN